MNRLAEIDKQGVATILFALRYLQENYSSSKIENSDHFNGEPFEPPTIEQIDRLCELINTKPVIIPATYKEKGKPRHHG